MRLSKIEEQKQRVQETRLYGDNIVCETQRVADVLENIDTLVSSLDAEFEKRTGIFNPNDMKYLFVAVMLQSLRWVISPELKTLNMENQELHVEKDQRLKSDEKNHKGGIYDGKSSGKKYEDKKINEYMKKHPEKVESAKKEYHGEKGRDTRYRSWIEILMRPVPYDATNSDDNGVIPNIANLNGFDENMMQYKNICGGNHHAATLGHDPVLGWIFGTMNIMSSTITFVNFLTFEVSQTNPQLNKWKQTINYARPYGYAEMLGYCIGSAVEDPKRIPAAVVRQSMHFASDKYCTEGLPIPLLGTIDPQRAQELIEKGWNSQELQYLLRTDLLNLGINAAVSILINLILKSIYLFCMDGEEDIEILKVRIQKILLVSNIISSSSNILYVAVTKRIGKLDVAGIGVTLLNLFKSKKFISDIKQEFIARGIEKAILGTSDWTEIALQEVYENER
ncbi:MAG: hypothetical protein J5979_05245 [Lachnospiraceae bacterium]|nr:hypothetical protein [Lachnospiraceae bacterium]